MGMQLTKFNIGDKVKIIDSSIKGRIIRIMMSTINSTYEVHWFNDNESITYWSYDWELELIEAAVTNEG